MYANCSIEFKDDDFHLISNSLQLRSPVDNKKDIELQSSLRSVYLLFQSKFF